MTVALFDSVDYASCDCTGGALESFLTVHNKASAPVNPSPVLELFGPVPFIISRVFYAFDSAGLPLPLTLAYLAVNTSGWSFPDGSKATLHVCPGHQNTPVIAADYGGAVNEGVTPGTDFASLAPVNDGIKLITLDADGLLWINTAGVTKFCIRMEGDILIQAPAHFDRLFVLYRSPQNSAPAIASVSPVRPTSARFTSVPWLGPSMPFLKTVYSGSPLSYPRLRFGVSSSGDPYTPTIFTPWRYGLDYNQVLQDTIFGLTPSTGYSVIAMLECSPDPLRQGISAPAYFNTPAWSDVSTFAGDIHIDQLKYRHAERMPV